MTTSQNSSINELWNLKWMAIELTKKCNFNCIHCRSNSDAFSEQGSLTSEAVSKLFTDIKTFASPVIVLTGGEPTIRKDFLEIAKLGTSLGFKMATATNGSTMTDELCQKMKEAGIRICSLSLDGPNAEIHDNFRQHKGAFESLLNAVEVFKRNDMPFIINSSFTQRNQPYIFDTFEVAHKLGATAWYMFMIVPDGRGKEVFNELITKDDYEKILIEHYNLERRLEAEGATIMVRPTCAPHYYRVYHEQSQKDGKEGTRRNLSFGTGGNKGCMAGQNIMFINNQGDVYPCSYFPVVAGNIFKTSIIDIWKKSNVLEDMRDIHSFKGACGACSYVDICGGCRARAYAVTGDYMTEEPFCKLAFNEI